MPRKWIVLLVLLTSLLAIFFWPVSGPGFDQLYANVPEEKVASLRAFRDNHPTSILEVEGLKWEYLVTGSGSETIVFLHGMTGSYDIWWQQIEALKNEFRIVTLTYPAANNFAEMEDGLLTILKKEGIEHFNLVGSSLGGYFTQYLVSKYPDRIDKAIFANTFPPNDLIKEKNGTIGSLIPYLPEWLVMNVLRESFAGSVFQASGDDELTLAFLNEISYGRASKAQVAGRYACVVEKFDPPIKTDVPLLIIEANNDPLVEEALRDQLKETYPQAKVVTVENGHFPYVSDPDTYTSVIREFLTEE